MTSSRCNGVLTPKTKFAVLSLVLSVSWGGPEANEGRCPKPWCYRAGRQVTIQNMMRIPVVHIVMEAIAELSRNKRALFPALVLPAVGMSLAGLISALLPLGFLTEVVSWLLYAPFYALFAVSCHRVVILGQEFLPHAAGLFWSERETKFVGWLLILGFVVCISGLVSIAFLFLSPERVGGIDVSWFQYVIIYVFITYILMRFSLVLPAAAVGKRLRMAESWLATAGNGMLLAIAFSIPSLLVLLLFWVLDSIVGNSEGPVHTTIFTIATYGLMAVEISVVSIAYKHLLPVEADAD